MNDKYSIVRNTIDDLGIWKEFEAQLSEVEKIYGKESSTRDLGVIAGMILSTGKADDLDCESFLIKMYTEMGYQLEKDKTSGLWKKLCVRLYDLDMEAGRLFRENEKNEIQLDIYRTDINKLKSELKKLEIKNEEYELELYDARVSIEKLTSQVDQNLEDNCNIIDEVECLREDNKSLKRVIKMFK